MRIGAAAVNDVELFSRLAAVPGLPSDLQAAIGARRFAAIQASWRAEPRCLVQADVRGEYLVGLVAAPVRWAHRGAGSTRLAQAALNPNRWIVLSSGRSRRAWHAAIDDALDSLARVDLELANLFAFSKRRTGPGLRLAEVNAGRTALRWHPPAPVIASLTFA